MYWIFLLLLLPPLLTLLYLVLSYRPPYDPVKTMIRRNRDIANFRLFGATLLRDRLQLRAGPNARLVTTFGIHNSFTTTEDIRHAEFLRRAVHAIKGADQAAWCRAWKVAHETMGTLILHCHRRELSVERVARILCFDAVLELLFANTRIQPFDVDHADQATKLINVLWQGSKKELDEDPQKNRLHSLHEALRELVSGDESETLALIMPAYETLWRVVCLTYVHVAFRYLDAAASDLIHEVVESVSRDGGVGGQLHPSVNHFAQEALRLYPPTKRIYRASSLRKAAADVESLHHDERIRGVDALEFRPSRFVSLTQDQNDAYMPFGIGKNACPAVNGFGRKMISFLVVVLIKRLGTSRSGARVLFGDEHLDTDTRALLPTGRSDLRDWIVVVNTTS